MRSNPGVAPGCWRAGGWGEGGDWERGGGRLRAPTASSRACRRWEDQFSPDEQKWWCKRSWTIAGYDAAEMKARNYPRVEPPAFAQIPCWQTCWEGMEPDADTCLKNDAPPPSTGTPGPSCKTTVHCSPTCSTSRFPSLPKFWDQWAADRATLLGGMTFPKLNVTGGPTGAGG
jgi:hypothetical protein